ncbi:hypothetical protein [Nitrosomonas sp. Nm33]|uniref:hypothetical protein n=1 Tax=Nitrosomonas sp. Nm33 TaxID=133724 RepID=UPI000897F148|nr:hypothetical protein [Nitrosomonas sp. Nm33]SDY82661.1 hypothetical protein SAMN05421755_105216 [Nitrosomonas sp. Nm33]
MKALLKDFVGIVVALVTFAIAWIVVAWLMSILFSIPIPRINDPDSDSFLNILKIWVLAPGISSYIAIIAGSYISTNVSRLLYGFLIPVGVITVFGIVSFAGVLGGIINTFSVRMSFFVFILQVVAIVVGAYSGKESVT